MPFEMSDYEVSGSICYNLTNGANIFCYPFRNDSRKDTNHHDTVNPKTGWWTPE